MPTYTFSRSSSGALTGLGTADDPFLVLPGSDGDVQLSAWESGLIAIYESLGLEAPGFEESGVSPEPPAATMTRSLEEPMYRILRAQAANLQRIQTGVQLDGTDGNGNPIVLWGPMPDLIRLYDTPLAFVETQALESWERIITLTPAATGRESRIANRVDRTFQYTVSMLVRLSQREMDSERQQVLVGNRRVDNALAEKMHRLLYDFHHVFFDNIFLRTEECDVGLVDDADYDTTWEQAVEFPYSLVTMSVSGTRSSW